MDKLIQMKVSACHEFPVQKLEYQNIQIQGKSIIIIRKFMVKTVLKNFNLNTNAKVNRKLFLACHGLSF